MQHTVFITGASSGLGKATAKFFQSKHWIVIATMRNTERETELNQLDNVVLLPLDVIGPQQIQIVTTFCRVYPPRFKSFYLSPLPL